MMTVVSAKPGEEAPLDGLKNIALFIDGLALERGIPLKPIKPIDVWRWARQRCDRLPTYRRNRRSYATMADPVAVRSWFSRRRFALLVDEAVSR